LTDPAGLIKLAPMRCRSVRLVLIAVCLVAVPFRAPAPLVYRPGEGWTYEPVGGGGTWMRPRAQEQLAVAQAAFDKKDYSLALKAARRVLVVWPVSDYAPEAQFLVARCYEASGKTEKAFKEYQTLLEKQPKFTHFGEIRQRQFEIANLYLAGKWFKLWGFVPFFSSMERTAKMYGDIVKTGPYSDVAPRAQLNIGTAREKEKTLGVKTPDYPGAAQAFEVAADRYHDQPKVASEAIFRAAMAYRMQAQTPDRDQTTAGQAIARFTDFIALYPNDPRTARAQQTISTLRGEQARGSFEIARFYEKRKKWDGARIYYNEVLLLDPNSPYAPIARQRIDRLKTRQPAPAK
jgi:outer membrane protein assembly factor BamD